MGLWVSAPMFGIDRDRRLDQLYHTKWTFSDGAPAEIFAIDQTTDGYLWLGTTTGLVRFDGYRFQKYGPELGPALAGRNVSSLLANPDGGLWIGFGSGGASLFKDGKVRNFGELEGLPSKSIRAFVRDRHGFVWAAGLGGLSRFDGAKWIRIGADWNFTESATAALVDQNGTLWVAANGRMYFLLDGASQFQKFSDFDGYVTKLSQSPDKTIHVSLLGDTNGVARPVGHVLRIEQPNLKMSSLAVLADDQNSVWVTTLGDGLHRLAHPENFSRSAGAMPGAEVETFTQKDGLSSDYIESIFEDREGNIWLGTNAGLDRFRQSSVVPVRFPPGFAYFSLVDGENGEVWASSLGHPTVAIRAGNPDFRSGTAASRLPSAASIYRNSKGVLWVNSYRGLYRIEAQKIDKINYPDNPDPNSDRIGSGIAATEDFSGSLWVSILGKGVFRLQNRSWISLQSLGGPAGYALSAFTDSAGRLWFGYLDKTVVMVDGSQIRVFSAKDGARIGKVRSIQGRDSHVWIAGDDGVALFDGKRFRQLITKDGVDLHDVFGIEEAEGDGLWFSENRGIIHVSSNELRAFEDNPDRRVDYQLFDLLDGLPEQLQRSTSNPSLIEDSDGRLWFATTRGMVWIDPKHISRNTVIPPLSIESITADGKGISPSPTSTLPPRTESVRIGYTALSLTIPERIRFKYKLDGQDKNWQDVGSRREAIYTNLGPGTYHFHVIACNNDGVWNDSGAELSFIIAPAFYQTLWFRVIEGIFVSGLLWGLYRLRLRQVTAHIQEQLGARLEERERIARELHDTLLQGFQGLVLRFQGAIKQIPGQEPSRRLMVEALDRADEALLEGRNRVRDLRSETAMVNELSESLRACIEELASDYPIEASVTEVGTRQPLHPIVRDEAYRIAREALSNAFQHSKASKIEAEISYHSENVRVIVRDDGGGINQSILNDGRSGHWGLSGMRERAEKIGAQFSIWSSPGAGTEIDLIIPAKVAYYRHPRRSLFNWINRTSSRGR
jgi:signal transduction histidine kinase/ligand-binding sensor domain-containing protein